MSLGHLARQALSHPPHIALAKGLAYGGRIIKASVRQVFERQRLSYEPASAGQFQSFLGGLKITPTGLPISKTMDHQFDLLGSGWTKVAHSPDMSQISPGNRTRAAAIRAMIGPGYSPIDWQLDFKSGYRWREDHLSGALRYGHEPGVDVKVPWELARLQHLPWLAMAGDKAAIQEFRAQVLDFAAANPPGYGVNWLCTMDVAIRAANILMAYDLFVAQGTQFDEGFLSEFNALIMAHGKHIMGNLEWHDVHRGNHYLADIVGLLFVAAYVPKSEQSDSWLNFATEQLISEVERQFTPDGANFEASTSYHRLSAEMVTYGTALVLGLDDAPEFPDWYFERLECMADFTMHVSKPNGHVVQIGDNDSGRFFKLCPLADLDHRATVGAINGLFDRDDLADFAGVETTFEASVVSTLAKGRKLKPSANPLAVGRTVEGAKVDELAAIADVIIVPPDPEVMRDLETCAYPDFGLYIWRSSRFFLSVRCGPVGQNGNGGHAHNDQLAIELNIDGEDWIADPGSYLYTPSPKDRDAYRSVHAHAAPKIRVGEPSRLDLGLFRLEDNANARCLSFGPDGFEGTHSGYGTPLHRCIELQSGSIRITDRSAGVAQEPVTINDAKSLRQLWKLDLPFSPGYGQQD